MVLGHLHTEAVRTWAFALRNLLMASRNVFFVLELTFWPVVSVLSIGLMTRFLDLSAQDTSFLLIGIIAQATVHVCQLDVAYAVLFDVWSKSMKHQFLAPIAIRHLTVGSWLVGVVRGLIVFTLLSMLARYAFGFDVLSAGASTVTLFLLGCFLMSLIVGVFVCTLILLFGTRAEASAWATVNLVLLVGGIYYPVSMLPGPVAAVASVIPLTYFLDAVRAQLGFPSEFPHAVLTGLTLALAYVVVTHWTLAAAVRRTRRTGLLLKMSD